MNLPSQISTQVQSYVFWNSDGDWFFAEGYTGENLIWMGILDPHKMNCVTLWPIKASHKAKYTYLHLAIYEYNTRT